MSPNLSLRGRLTITILLLTGALSALAVVLGMSILQGEVRAAAIEDQIIVRSDPFDGDIAPDELSVGTLADEGLFIDDLGVLIDGAFNGELSEIDAFEAEYLADVIARLGLYPELNDAFGTEDGRLMILLSTGNLATIDGSGGIDLDVSADPGEVFILSSSLNEIGGSIFEPIDDLDATMRQFELGEHTIAGSRYGLLAEVTDELRALDEVSQALWFSAAVLSLAAGAATWLLIGRALAPVEAITNRVSEITSGNLSDRVPVPGRRDEIGTLATTMNTMLGRLETADLRRRRFFSDASHELRTPVAVLQSEAEVARRAPNSTTIEELSGVVLAESHRLGAMVEDLLSIARNDEQRAANHEGGAVDVDEVVLLESQRTRRVPVDRSEVSAGRVSGQAQDVGRVIAHLLDNAARHASSKVAIGVQTSKGQVRSWVDDDGPGISPQHRLRIFERFVRLDDARTRDRGGVGLGLSVVKTTVENMGGTIDVVDSPLGGSRFVIHWPALAAE